MTAIIPAVLVSRNPSQTGMVMADKCPISAEITARIRLINSMTLRRSVSRWAEAAGTISGCSTASVSGSASTAISSRRCPSGA